MARIHISTLLMLSLCARTTISTPINIPPVSDVKNCYWTLRDTPQDRRVVHSASQECFQGALLWSSPFGGLEVTFNRPSSPPIDPFIKHDEPRVFCYSIEQRHTQVKVDREVTSNNHTSFHTMQFDGCTDDSSVKIYAEAVPNTVSNIIGEFSFLYVWRTITPFEECRKCSPQEINYSFCSSQFVSRGRTAHQQASPSFMDFHVTRVIRSSDDILHHLRPLNSSQQNTHQNISKQAVFHRYHKQPLPSPLLHSYHSPPFHHHLPFPPHSASSHHHAHTLHHAHHNRHKPPLFSERPHQIKTHLQRHKNHHRHQQHQHHHRHHHQQHQHPRHHRNNFHHKSSDHYNHHQRQHQKLHNNHHLQRPQQLNRPHHNLHHVQNQNSQKNAYKTVLTIKQCQAQHPLTDPKRQSVNSNDSRDESDGEFILSGDLVLGKLNVHCMTDEKEFEYIWEELVRGGSNICSYDPSATR